MKTVASFKDDFSKISENRLQFQAAQLCLLVWKLYFWGLYVKKYTKNILNLQPK